MFEATPVGRGSACRELRSPTVAAARSPKSAAAPRGIVFGVHLSIAGCCLAINGLVLSRLLQWSLYSCSVSFFHFSEFFVTAVFKPDVVSYNSFVLNHSEEYTGALLVCWAEFLVEALLLPELKQQPGVVVAGVVLVLVGHWFRVGAMWTAGSNFNHEIMQRREETHQLVTHGVYRFLRHPSYFGWFWWSLGTQLLLCNPLCFLVYVAAASSFFRRRIPYEEALLENFYPDQYPAYARRTFVGIPFVPNRGRRSSAAAASTGAGGGRGSGGGGGETTALNAGGGGGGGGGNGRSPPPSDYSGSPAGRASRNSACFSEGM
eukprot:g5010.t1